MDVPVPHVPTPHLRYVDEFIGTLDCAPKLLELRLMPNAKELSETIAAFHAIRTHLPSFSLTDESVSLVAVGDGATPRLAALAAFLTRWTCHSVDPLLPSVNRWTAVERLRIYSGKIEDFRFKVPRCVVVLMHAHVPLPKALESIASDFIGIIVCPCCDFYDKHRLDRPVDLEYEDWGILSPHRLLRVWRPSNAPPVTPLSALDVSPLQVQTAVANRLAIPISDAAWLLKHDLVSYFEQARAAGAGPQCISIIRLAKRLAPALEISAVPLPPPEWLAEIATQSLLQAERRELLRQVLLTGKAPKAITLAQNAEQTPVNLHASLLRELQQVAAQRPGLAEELRQGPPRPQIVSFLLGVLIKSGGRSIPPDQLRTEVVLPFCQTYAQYGSDGAKKESGTKRERE